MLVASQLVRFRQRAERQQRNLWGRVALLISGLVSLLIAGAGIAAGYLYTDLVNNLPSLQTLPVLLDPPNGWLLQPTRLYDRSGKQLIASLEHPAARDRQYVFVDPSHPDHFSPAIITATLATADATFWSNPGYSLSGLGQGSHPTLAQRLAADLLLWNEAPGWRRDLRERYLAAQITAQFGREKVLEWFLNSAQYGPRIYGADAAARVYFGKAAVDLSLAEAALLAAVAEAPDLNPLDAPDLAVERQKQVIQQMWRQGWISQEAALAASQEELAFRGSQPESDSADAFIGLALDQLTEWYPLDRLERGGLRVITTLDADLQSQAHCAMTMHIARFEGAQVSPALDEADCQAARLLPTLLYQEGVATRGLGAAIVILDPQTGQVLALVGEARPGLDPSRLPGRPAGTLLTPFIYLTGFTKGLGPATLLWDIPAQPSESVPETQNLNDQFHGPVRLRVAMANDYLMPAAQVVAQVGIDSVWRTLMQSGLTSAAPLLPANDRLAVLRQHEVTLLQATQAYGMLANQGLLAGQLGAERPLSGRLAVEPVTVLRLEDLDRQPWLEWPGIRGRSVLSPQLAYLVTHILSDEAARWPGLGHPNLLEIGRPAAAKLGQTFDGNDAWTVGYTPRIVVGVWVGKADLEAPGRITPDLAAALWRAVVQYASFDQPLEGWQTPGGVSTISVCEPSGLLPTKECSTIVEEIFLSGFEPKRYDSLFRTFEINRETGRLATVFTPPGLVEERVYMLAPPEAEGWARQAGFDAPPDQYDVIPAAVASANVNLSAPGMFAYVSGAVTFRGRATGEDFSFYRLQVGKGINPRQWVQITEDRSTPVEDGVLGVWNTQGLNGLYAVQLLVAQQDQRVETAVILVTVDNQIPEVVIVSPVEGQQFSGSSNQSVLFQVDASDDMALAQVVFYLDDQMVASLVEYPFTLVWPAKPGSHRLRVEATDRAGNLSKAQIAFVVGK
jgi:membrane peptidoglycan carboxypeptidase